MCVCVCVCVCTEEVKVVNNQKLLLTTIYTGNSIGRVTDTSCNFMQAHTLVHNTSYVYTKYYRQGNS